MRAKVLYLEEDFPIDDIDNENWQKADVVKIEKYWSGEIAPASRHAETRLLWSPTAIYVRFEAAQNEPLIVSEKPNLREKTCGLWERDVCEIFLAPNLDEPRRYFEFEIAPNGEWVDLLIHQLPEKRETDFSYHSNMVSATRIEADKTFAAIKINWEAFGKKTPTGEIWRGNLFRCIGAGKERGYLAWSPTFTEIPNFHVPERFGEFEFVIK